jgi:hypothetical protein
MSQAALDIKPRYHFVGGFNTFFEREPYILDDTVTRFISLGDFGNAVKERWFYAFFIDPKKVDDKNALGLTPNPYSSIGFRQKRSADKVSFLLFCD